MENKTLTPFLVMLIAIALILMVMSFASLVIVQEARTLDVQLKVSNNLGFNADTDKMYFGTIPQGDTGSKRMLIENREYKKSVVRIKVFGELQEWITVSENNFILKKGEAKLILVKAKVPNDSPLKDYQSKITVFFTRY